MFFEFLWKQTGYCASWTGPDVDLGLEHITQKGMQPQMSSYECRIHRADKRKQKTDRNQTFTFHYETKGPWRSGSESLTQALISWGHDWICGIRVTHSWPWSKPALGQPWRIQTRARTTVSGILLRLTAHWTYERWCFLAASNEAESGPLELKTRWNICKNVCRQSNMTRHGAGWSCLLLWQIKLLMESQAPC